jgi:penicillin-binding protein 2
MNSEGKKYFFLSLIIVLPILLISRLIQIQFLNQEEYGKESQRNSVKKITITPARGLIYDYSGRILVDNKPAYSLTITPAQFDSSIVNEISSLIDIPADDIKTKLSDAKGTNRFNPVKIKRDIDFKVIAYIEENRDKFRGIDFQVESLRTYPNKFRGSHVFGYTGEITPKQLESQVGSYYKQGDIIGATALEKSYENYLRGEKGYKFTLVDVRGREVAALNNGNSDVKPINGTDLVLSLDAELQDYAEKLLSKRRGAIVAMDPRNGEILCLVSKPDFDLSVFSGSVDSKIFSMLINDESKPLFDRAIQSKYPPGSTWKPMMSLIGLASGSITTHSTISCEGSFTWGSRTWEDHGAYGPITVVTAIEKSANVFFYKLGLKVGLENYDKYSKLFNFGTRTGIDLPNETYGLLPSEEYYNKIFPKGWSQAVLINLGIGQGELLVSPVQLAAYTAAISMNGLYNQPHLVRKFRNPMTGEEENNTFESKKIDFPQSYYDAVKKGMYLVVNGTGTAKNIKNSEYDISGKTGTAQNPNGNNHSWFIGFAPFENPQIAVCVLGENAGWGNQFAAPMAAAIMVRYLSRNAQDTWNENAKIEVHD